MKNFTQVKKVFLLLMIVLTHFGVKAQTAFQTFTSTSTFTVPAGVTQITVEAWGGGGRGGSRASSTNGCGGGGGGAYARRLVTVTPLTTYTVTVGTGATNTSPGNDSWFINNTTILAKGGNSVANNTITGATGGAAASCIGDVGGVFSGGNGANGVLVASGGGGGAAAGNTNNGNPGLVAVGGTGTNGGGSGGAGRTTSNGVGIAGSPPGGGGGGALRIASGNATGGNGADGQIIITYPIPEINVTGNGNAITDGGGNSPALANFTTFPTSTVGFGVTRTFTIQNTGTNASLTVGAFTIAGANPGDFSVTTLPSSTVGASSSTTFVVTFTPTAAGTRNATISFVNNDSDENPYNFNLQGDGILPEINVTGNGNPITDGGGNSPALANFTTFPNSNVGFGITRTFTIQNTSASAILTIGAFTIAGANPSDFSVTTLPSSPVGSSSSTTFVVTFTPTAAGTRNATISFVNNDSDENPYNFNLQGVGLAPEMNVNGNGNSITDGDATPVNTDWTDFGSTTIGGSFTRTFTIQNTGTLTLNVGTISIVGTNASEFEVTTAPSATVAAGSSTTFVVTFYPAGTGTRSAGISIVNDDTDENPYNYAIQGTGASNSAEIEIRGNLIAIVDGDTTPVPHDSTDFGGTTVSSGVSRIYTIYNTGSSILNVGAITFSGTNAADFAVTLAPAATVAATTGTTTFTVTFTPSATGTRTATMSVINSDGDENPYNFAIEGEGQTALTYGPGGVTSPLQLWLRSDLLNGTTGVADGSAVNTWNTQARGTNATKPAAVGAPIYRNNATHNINFNSVVDFTNNYTTAPQVYTDNDATRQYLKGASGFYTHDMYVVLIPDVSMTSALASNDIFCGDRNSTVQETDATGIGYAAYTSRMVNEVLTYAVGTSSGVGLGYGVADRSTTSSYSTAGIVNARNDATTTGTELTFNANNVINHTTDATQFANTTDSQYWIGRSEGWDGSLDGRVGEIIALNRRASDIEKSNIQSYLAIKYGITLGVNGTSMNYTNSDGTIIWDATANAGFNFDIAGIGQDDISRLNQKQSKSINPTEVMTIGLTDIYTTNTANTNTFATNKSYLVWGANGGTMVDSGVNLNIDLGPTTITTITEVVNRKWKLVETGGDVGTTRVAIPTASFVSGLPVLGPTDAYVMVVATNAAFTTGVETVFMSTTGGNQTCLYDFDGTKYISFGVAHQAVNPLHITLDGMDDFVKIDNANEISAAFTIMTWIRPNGNNTLANGRTILAKKAAATSGYQLVLQTDNKVRMEWSVSGTTYSLITNTSIPNLMWHNIAVTYGSNILSIYIDGVLDATATITTAPVATTANFSIGGQYIDKSNINNLFRGDIDELRMWNKVVTINEIRYIMNQEILQNTTGTRGTVMPTTVTKNDISTLLWSNLYAYYSMNSYIGTHLDDDSVNINRGSLVIPDKISINLQTAPMPYISAANGLWSSTATWTNGSIQDLPYSLSIVDGTTPVDWNIVRSTHTIDSSGNKVLLGLFVNSNTLTASNDSKIEVSHHLKLDGKIDLVGKSQLIQTLNSDLDPTSAGSIERDQQGQKSRFNYNYFSSPVGAINAVTNNNTYTVNGVMKDGTTATPQNITWTTSYNGSPTSPITLSSYWIFKFQNLSNAYANWQSVGQSGSLSPGQGYTLKGPNTAAKQNYTFVGKPNNGLVTSTVSPNNLNLCGNPYASAIDAHDFIDANVTSLNGTLYFWEHFNSNTSHNLLSYQGGYAQRTKVGGTAAIQYPGVTGTDVGTIAPGRYIPVGQGFFVIGTATGGTITFNNNQRKFFREENVLSNLLIRANQSILTVDHFDDNSEDAEPIEEDYKKIRLGFDDRNGYHRQVLLGFMNNNATSSIDPGYDAIHIDDQPNDMCFLNGTTKVNIAGEGFFSMNNIYPLGVKTDAIGTVTFKLDDTENFDHTIGIYIHDNQTNNYHDIKNNNFTIELPQGIINNRFSLRFKEENALNTNDFSLNDGIIIMYTSSNSMLNIKNKLTDVLVEKVTLYNILGQSISSWNTKNDNQQSILLPIKTLSSGTYIVKLSTDKGDISKKIIID